MKQKEIIQYWLNYASEDQEAAIGNFKLGHYDWCLFMWHLVIEKTFKAVIVNSGQTPLYTHNLLKLFEQSGLDIADEYLTFLKEIGTFNLEARYDDYKRSFKKKATKQYTQKWINNCEEVYQWLLKQI